MIPFCFRVALCGAMQFSIFTFSGGHLYICTCLFSVDSGRYFMHFLFGNIMFYWSYMLYAVLYLCDWIVAVSSPYFLFDSLSHSYHICLDICVAYSFSIFWSIFIFFFFATFFFLFGSLMEAIFNVELRTLQTLDVTNLCQFQNFQNKLRLNFIAQLLE